MGSDSPFGEPFYSPIDLTPDDVRRKMDAARARRDIEAAYTLAARMMLVGFVVGIMLGMGLGRWLS